MNKTISLLITGIFIVVFFACTMGPKLKDGMTIRTRQQEEGTRLKISFTKGKHFSNKAKLKMMQLLITPQIAVWIEDKKGNLSETLFVTRAFGKQNWKMAKFDPDKVFRISSLPVWMNKMISSGKGAPTRNNPLPDALTSATPTGSFQLETVITQQAPCRLFVEVNNSFNENEYYNEEKGGSEQRFKGQPAVIWSCEISSLEKDKKYDLSIIGHASSDGNDPKCYPDMKTITTAQEIFKEISLTIE